jgi:hypothetical protein
VADAEQGLADARAGWPLISAGAGGQRHGCGQLVGHGREMYRRDVGLA